MKTPRASLSGRLGPWTYAELLSAMSHKGIASALKAGELTRVLPDLYAAAAHAASNQVRVRAASRWAPSGSAVTARSALFEWRIVSEPPMEVTLVVPRGCHRHGAPWIRVVSQTLPFERFDGGDGLALVLPELALIHAFSQEPQATRSELVYRACANGVSAERVLDRLTQLPRARGRGELIRLLTLAAQGVESYLEESAIRRVFVGDAFDVLVLQHRVRVDGKSFRLDAYDPRSQTAFELDGDGAHSDPPAQRRDRRRDALLATLGILTIRFSFVDVMNRPEWCRAVALRVMKARSTT